jgi:hypothetical protein
MSHQWQFLLVLLRFILGLKFPMIVEILASENALKKLFSTFRSIVRHRKNLQCGLGLFASTSANVRYCLISCSHLGRKHSNIFPLYGDCAMAIAAPNYVFVDVYYPNERWYRCVSLRCG